MQLVQLQKKSIGIFDIFFSIISIGIFGIREEARRRRLEYFESDLDYHDTSSV